MANPEITFVNLLYISKLSTYCYHLVNVISLVLAQSDHIKQHLLDIKKQREINQCKAAFRRKKFRIN
jgi:hypothetical protein